MKNFSCRTDRRIIFEVVVFCLKLYVAANVVYSLLERERTGFFVMAILIIISFSYNNIISIKNNNIRYCHVLHSERGILAGRQR